MMMSRSRKQRCRCQHCILWITVGRGKVRIDINIFLHQACTICCRNFGVKVVNEDKTWWRIPGAVQSTSNWVKRLPGLRVQQVVGSPMEIWNVGGVNIAARNTKLAIDSEFHMIFANLVRISFLHPLVAVVFVILRD